MASRQIHVALGALVLTQAAHSTEEYVGRLWETFPPARIVSDLVSDDPGRGFLVANLLLVSFGLWTWLGPVRRKQPIGELLAWIWVAIEVINGIAHPLWALRRGGYTPGLATAPILLLFALLLARRLRQVHHSRSPSSPIWSSMK